MTWKPDEKMTERQIEKELQRQAVLFEEACMKGNVVAAIKFKDFARQWFKEYAEIRLKLRTVEGYHQMEKRIYKAIGHIRLDKLTTRHIQKFIIELCDAEREDGRNRNGGKLSTKTIKLYKSMISTICDYAVKMQMIPVNPCKNVTIPKVITPEKEFYSIEEAQQMLDLFRNEDESNYKYVCFYTLAVYTGFRLGELMGLEWKDINLETNVITVNRTCLYSKAKGGLYTETPKTSQSMRSLKVVLGKSFIDGQINSEAAISITFDQSPLIDESAERERDRADVSDGIMAKWEYRAKWYGESDEEAKRNIPSDDDTADMYPNGADFE